MSAIFTIRKYTSIYPSVYIYFKTRSNLWLQFCELCLSTGLEQETQDADKCIILHFSKVSNTMRVYTNVRKVVISKATLQFRKVTKDFKQKRVDDGNEKVNR